MTTARSTGDEVQEIAFPAPAAAPGGHIVTAVAYDRELGQYVSASVIFTIEEGMQATPSATLTLTDRRTDTRSVPTQGP